MHDNVCTWKRRSNELSQVDDIQAVALRHLHLTVSLYYDETLQ